MINPAKRDQWRMNGAAAFSPGGNGFAGQSGTRGGGADGRLHFWRAPLWAEIEKAEAAERAGAKP